MKLHRTTGRSDWADIARNRRNAWQKLAASTRGILTPGNILTVLGVVIVVFGLIEILDEHYWRGFFLLIVGRLLDVVDGWAAEATSTKSPLGELLDASMDKLTTVMMIGVLYYIAIVPRWVLLALVAPHIFIAIIAIVAYVRQKRFHPSVAGKLSMAVLWVSLIGLVALQTDIARSLEVMSLSVYALSGLSVIMGFYALVGYATGRD